VKIVNFTSLLNKKNCGSELSEKLGRKFGGKSFHFPPIQLQIFLIFLLYCRVEADILLVGAYGIKKETDR